MRHFFLNLGGNAADGWHANVGPDVNSGNALLIADETAYAQKLSSLRRSIDDRGSIVGK